MVNNSEISMGGRFWLTMVGAALQYYTGYSFVYTSFPNSHCNVSKLLQIHRQVDSFIQLTSQHISCFTSNTAVKKKREGCQWNVRPFKYSTTCWKWKASPADNSMTMLLEQSYEHHTRFSPHISLPQQSLWLKNRRPW